MALTTKAVEALAKKGSHKPGRHTDGQGMHLFVRPDGATTWVLRFRLHDRQRDFVIGAFPEISLKEARDLAYNARQLVKAGKDPILERRRVEQEAALAANVDHSFKAATEELIEARAATWRNEKHKWQWKQTLETHAFPILGKMQVQDIETDHVLRVLKPLWARIPETASRVRGRIEAILDYARASGWRRSDVLNPARWKGNLADLLPRIDKIAKEKHYPALPWHRVPAFMQALRARPGMTPDALQFCILAAVRSNELRGMRWGELDGDTRTWIIPADRMKTKEIHRVPVTDQMQAILDKVRVGKPRRDDLVFHGRDLKAPLSAMSMVMLVRGMASDGLEEGDLPRWADLEGRVIVPHGFRSSFRDWAGETRSEGREVAERALAHVVSGVEGAYARSDLLERRRPLMQAWSTFATGPTSAVVVPFSSPRVA